LQSRQADRRKGDGHGHILPYHLRPRVPSAHIYGNALAQSYIGKVIHVVAKGLLRPTARLRVVKKHLGDAAAVNLFQVINICYDRHGVLVRS
jgi:hypothetical protein